MKTIPIDDHCATLNEIYSLASANRYPGQKQAILNRIQRALQDAGSIENHKGWRDYIPSFFDWRKPCQNQRIGESGSTI